MIGFVDFFKIIIAVAIGSSIGLLSADWIGFIYVGPLLGL